MRNMRKVILPDMTACQCDCGCTIRYSPSVHGGSDSHCRDCLNPPCSCGRRRAHVRERFTTCSQCLWENADRERDNRDIRLAANRIGLPADRIELVGRKDGTINDTDSRSGFTDYSVITVRDRETGKTYQIQF